MPPPPLDILRRNLTGMFFRESEKGGDGLHFISKLEGALKGFDLCGAFGPELDGVANRVCGIDDDERLSVIYNHFESLTRLICNLS